MCERERGVCVGHLVKQGTAVSRYVKCVQIFVNRKKYVYSDTVLYKEERVFFEGGGRKNRGNSD